LLGDGARDRGALCDQISTNPAFGAGVGYLRLEADPDPIRVRSAFVSDHDIRAMAADYAPPPVTLRALPGGEVA
jgi:DNA segregation ATPase FtsK/SpoIIIE, S-DNA-T family